MKSSFLSLILPMFTNSKTIASLIIIAATYKSLLQHPEGAGSTTKSMDTACLSKCSIVGKRCHKQQLLSRKTSNMRLLTGSEG